MSKRIERTGVDLEMWVMQRAAELLNRLPFGARVRAVKWLAESVTTDTAARDQDRFAAE